MAQFAHLLRRLAGELGQHHRYAHSVRVARCAELLAQRHGLDTHRARLAGLLHDVARLYPPEMQLAQCEARGLPVGEHERAYPVLLHARLGAAIARERFGVDDAQVLSAIEKHTTGAGDMLPLDCAVYLADSLEPARTFPEREALWNLALDDLDAAMRGTLRSTLAHNAGRGVLPAPETLAAARRFGLPALAGTLPEARASAG